MNTWERQLKQRKNDRHDIAKWIIPIGGAKRERENLLFYY